jgi:hypothetical protein
MLFLADLTISEDREKRSNGHGSTHVHSTNIVLKLCMLYLPSNDTDKEKITLHNS